MTACVADSSDLAVDAEVERLSKKYAPFVKERDGAGESGVVDELALEAAQLRIDDEYRAAAGSPRLCLFLTPCTPLSHLQDREGPR